MKRTDGTVVLPEDIKKARKEMQEALKPIKIKQVSIPSLNLVHLKLKIVGDSDLIVHQFSVDVVHGIENKQQGKATAGREKRDPAAEIERSFYKEGDKYVYKAQAFKLAATECCTSLGKTIPKTLVRQSHHVIGAMIELHGDWYPRTDMTRPQPGVCTPAYRPAFKAGWWVVLPIVLNQNALSVEQLVTLYNHAGFSVGVGSWRPTKNGSFGMFHVEEVLQ